MKWRGGLDGVVLCHVLFEPCRFQELPGLYVDVSPHSTNFVRSARLAQPWHSHNLLTQPGHPATACEDRDAEAEVRLRFSA